METKVYSQFDLETPIFVKCWYEHENKEFLALAELSETGFGPTVIIHIIDKRWSKNYCDFIVKNESLIFNPKINCEFEGFKAIYNLLKKEVTIIDQDCYYAEKQLLVKDMSDLKFPTRKELIISLGISSQKGANYEPAQYEPAQADLIFSLVVSPTQRIILRN